MWGSFPWPGGEARSRDAAHALAAKRAGIRRLYVPEDNAPEATLAGEIEVFPVANVRQLVDHLSGGSPSCPPGPGTLESAPPLFRILQR